MYVVREEKRAKSPRNSVLDGHSDRTHRQCTVTVGGALRIWIIVGVLKFLFNKSTKRVFDCVFVLIAVAEGDTVASHQGYIQYVEPEIYASQTNGAQAQM